MSSSSSSSNTKKLIAVGAVAAVGVGGALWYYKYRQQQQGGSADDEAAFTKKATTTTTTTTTTARSATATTAARTTTTTAASSNTTATATKPRTTTTTTTTSATPAATTTTTARAPSTGSTTTSTVSSAPPTATHSLRQPQPPYVDFDKYHCRVRPVAGWEAVTEPSPIPTSGVILVRRPEFAEQMQQMQGMPHGAIPMVLVTIEDVSADGSTAEEVKDKTVLMARQQMLMFTNGMMEPQIESDKKVSDAGVFDYYVEVNQLIPGIMDMKMGVYTTVKSGVAYCFQLIASPSVFRENKNAFKQMVQDFQLIEAAHKDYTEVAYLEHHVNNICVKTPPSWRAKKSIEEGVLVEFTTSSQSRPDTVTIYKGDEAHKPSATASVKTSVVGGVTVQSYTEGASQRERRRLVISGNYTIIAVPQKTTKSPVSNNDLVALAKSISSSTTTSGIYFVNVADKYKCAVRDRSSIVHSVLGDAVMYFPAGIEAMREGSSDEPSVTIRCGHPDTDETCAASLSEWRQRMLQEDKTIGHIEDTTIDGTPAITFSTTEMQETAPGCRTEVKTSVFMAVRQDGSTCLIRWECDTGAFRRHEKNMINFVDAFQML